MTLVTTSRRSTTISRAVARDLAFALGARYLARGKRGIRDLTDIDSSFFILTQEDRDMLLQWYQNGDLVLQRRIIKTECTHREGFITRGVVTSDPELFQPLTGQFPVIEEKNDDLIIRADGPQRRCTILRLKKCSTENDDS
jgi:U3 small nucleolar ribonucleoprotein protein IMP4